MNRFAFLPLVYDQKEDAIPREFIVDPNTGHMYIKGIDDIIRSKTVDLEGIAASLTTGVNLLNSKIGDIYFRINENDLLEISVDNLTWAPVSMTSQSILEKLRIVDGTGSELDADLLDGKHASAFSLSGHNHDTKYLGISANAVSASKWATARTLTLNGDLVGSVSIDGSKNIILDVAVNDNSHNHAKSNITGLQNDLIDINNDITVLNTKVGNIYFKIDDNNLLNTSIDNINWTPVSMTPQSILEQLATVDGAKSGLDADLLDGLHAADLSLVGHNHDAKYLGISANAVSASKWVTARTITLDGDLTGNVSINGSSNVTLTANVVDNSHNHTTSNITGLDNKLSNIDNNINGLTSKVNGIYFRINENNLLEISIDNLTWLPVSMTAQSILDKLITIDGADSGLDADLLDGKHASAFSLSGHNHDAKYLGILANAVSASKWLSARTITLAGDLTGNVSIDGSSNVTLTASVVDDSHNHIIGNIDGLQDVLDTKSNNHTHPYAPSSHPNVIGTAEGLGHIKPSSSIFIDSTTGIAIVVDDSHNHIISNVDGLQTALNAKSDNHSHPYAPSSHPNIIGSSDILGHIKSSSSISISSTTGVATVVDDSHNHIIGNVDGLQDALDTKSDVHSHPYAASSHNHSISNVTGLQSALDAKLASSSYTAADVLTKLLTVDGTSSGLDADLLDGKHASEFAASGHNHSSTYLGISANAASASKWATARTITLDGDLSGSVSINGTANVTLTATVKDDSHNHLISNVDGLQTALNAKLASSSYTAADVLAKFKTVDGSGSGADSDLLDGQHGTYYYRKLTTKTAGEFYTGTTAPASTNRVNFDGYFYASRVYNAWYNDYAEYFEKGEETEAGDIVMIDPDTGKYIKSNGYANKLVRGVHSNEYGHCLGGDGGENVEERFTPIGLAGKVHVKLIGKAKIGQNIVSSDIPGVGIATDEYIPGAVIGQCEQDKDTNDIGMIKMFIVRM